MPQPRRTLLLLWLGCYALLLCFAHGNLESTDSGMTMHAARALLQRGDSGMRLSAEAEPLDEALIAQVIRAGKYGKLGSDGEHAYIWFPIGHVWLMLPCVAVGEALQRAFPGVEAHYRELTTGAPDGPGTVSYRDGHYVFDHAMVAMTLPAMFGATSLLLLLLIAEALGCTRRQALLSAVAIVFGTQCFAVTRETLSDGPGLCFLLAALLATVRYHEGIGSWRTLLLGGAMAGCAVLTRYAHGLLVPVLLLAVALAAHRRGRWQQALWFALGGLPFAVLLAAVDHARFGSITDTGYPPFLSWFELPPWIGVPKILLAFGKGVLWLSPLSWLAVPMLLRRAVPLRWLSWTLLLIPLLLFGCTQGWQSGQCWGVRYVTPGIVCMLGIALPQLRPWQRWPKTFFALLGLGVLVNVTSVLAPMHGHNQIAGQALMARAQQQLERGEITVEDYHAIDIDQADRFFFEWRYSPLHANWTYAWLSLQGRFGDDQLHPKESVADTIAPLFGVDSPVPTDGTAPVRWEDRGFRHLWFVFWGTLLCVPWWLLLLPVAAASALLLRAACRRM